jgi:integrase
MFAFSYDAALRREELCGLETRDLDVANRMITVRAETTKADEAVSYLTVRMPAPSPWRTCTSGVS